jgi:hypothetical protein
MSAEREWANHDRLAAHMSAQGPPLSQVWMEFMAEIGAEHREVETLRAALNGLIESLARTSPGHLDTTAGRAALDAAARGGDAT